MIYHIWEKFYVTGPQALDLIQWVTINDASNLSEGQAQYSVMCYEDGGIVDDLLVYNLTEGDGYMLVVNAANIAKDLAWISEHNRFDAEVNDISTDTCLLAVQGPKSVETLQKITSLDLDEIKYYRFTFRTVCRF
ncbi:MAG: hypothetical protein U5K69_11960 [Balneolaceae bacterium]|nr:hypothetical protein [Balneolaceae bacterium]